MKFANMIGDNQAWLHCSGEDDDNEYDDHGDDEEAADDEDGDAVDGC